MSNITLPRLIPRPKKQIPLCYRSQKFLQVRYPRRALPLWDILIALAWNREMSVGNLLAEILEDYVLRLHREGEIPKAIEITFPK